MYWDWGQSFRFAEVEGTLEISIALKLGIECL